MKTFFVFEIFFQPVSGPVTRSRREDTGAHHSVGYRTGKNRAFHTCKKQVEKEKVGVLLI